MLLLSQALLWIVVICLSVAVLALARQVGVLHERVAPAGALDRRAGPGVGEQAPRLEVQTLAGNRHHRRRQACDRQALLLLFVSPTCPICKKLIPIALDFAKSERLDVLFVGDADMSEQREIDRSSSASPRSDFVNGPRIGLTYRVDKLPYAVLLDDRA